MIQIKNNSIYVTNTSSSDKSTLEISFKRTYRLPDDHQQYTVQRKLGQYMLHEINNSNDVTPTLLLPLYQSEACWLNLESIHPTVSSKPFAVQIKTGQRNGLTGAPWEAKLNPTEQNYLVVHSKAFYDGLATPQGVVIQLAPKSNWTEHRTQAELNLAREFGDIEFFIYPLKEEIDYQNIAPIITTNTTPPTKLVHSFEKDPFGAEAWNSNALEHCRVHLINSKLWQQLTDKEMPGIAPSIPSYGLAGLPWMPHYDEPK